MQEQLLEGNCMKMIKVSRTELEDYCVDMLLKDLLSTLKSEELAEYFILGVLRSIQFTLKNPHYVNGGGFDVSEEYMLKNINMAYEVFGKSFCSFQEWEDCLLVYEKQFYEQNKTLVINEEIYLLKE